LTDLSNYSSNQLRAMLRNERRAATARIMILKREIRSRVTELEALQRRIEDIDYSEDALG
jgi:hypothetical protein